MSAADYIRILATHIPNVNSLKRCFYYSIESTMTADKLLIVTSVDMLCSQNILTYNEAVEICLANNQAKMKILDDKLAAMSPGTYSM